MSTADGEFVKYDKEKNPLHLLPTVALEKVGEVLAFGARKYAPNGWRNVDKRSRYFSALLRHAFQWWRGEVTDSETGLPHLSHLACCALFLSESELLGYGEDDRPTILPTAKASVDMEAVIQGEALLRGQGHTKEADAIGVWREMYSGGR
jgi:hypothetical protein